MKVSVLDFGAKATLDSLQTEAFQKAIDTVFLAGGGEVTVPKGNYLLGDIRLRSNITLHLEKDAVLYGSMDPKEYYHFREDKIEPIPEDWLYYGPILMATKRLECGSQASLYSPGNNWNYGLIRIIAAENVRIIGEEGSGINGQNCYDENGEEDYRGPHGINAQYSRNLYFSGYTAKDTGNWAHCNFNCESIIVDNVTVLGGHDGYHFRGCRNVEVRNCYARTGDDTVAGFDNINAYIHDCDFSSACSVFRFGGTNILIKNVKAKGPCEYPFRGSLTPEEKAASVADSPTSRKNCVSFLTYFIDRSRTVQVEPDNIIVKDCELDNVDRLVRINLSGMETWQQGSPAGRYLFENVTVKDCNLHMLAYGDGSVPFKMDFKNCSFRMKDGSASTALMHAGNHGEISFEKVTIENLKGNAIVRTWGDPELISCDEVTVDVDDISVAEKADFAFKG